jgi:secernin
VCDSLCALAPATGTGVTLFAKNSDRPPDEAQRLEHFPARRDSGLVRATYVEVDPHPGETVGVVGSRPWWMWGLEHGVNEAGVAIGNEMIFTTADPRGLPPGLVGMDLVRLGLERATTAEEAVGVVVELLQRHGQGGSGQYGTDRPYWSSFLVVDPGDAWVLETSDREWATERVDRTRAISNRTTIPAFTEVHRHPKQPDELVDPRWEASRKVLAAEPVGVDDVAAHLRCHTGEKGYTVCMHVDGLEATTASVIAELGPDRSLARWCAGSPCSSVYVPLWVGREIGEPVAWERFAGLTPEHRPALDELEAGLAADCTDDDAWAAEAWRRVDATLTTLGL